MPIFEIDPDIRKAWTLPSRFYTDERYFELSKDKIFARCWHLACRDDEFESLRPETILPGFLNEPVLLSKSGQTTYCLSNVCTHRGNILLEKPCNAKLIRCGYHGRRFSLAGKFLSMPEFEGVEDFPCESDDLHRYALAERGGFLFVSADPVADFDAFVGGASEQLIKIKAKDLKLAETKVYEVAAHWALYCENYLEGFHIPYVHKGLNEIVDY